MMGRSQSSSCAYCPHSKRGYMEMASSQSDWVVLRYIFAFQYERLHQAFGEIIGEK